MSREAKDRTSGKSESQPQNLSPAVLQKCKEILEKGINHAMQKHDDLMDRLLDVRGAYEVQQMESFHGQVVSSIVNALHRSFQTFRNSSHPNLLGVFDDSLKTLQSKMNSRLLIYLQKHEIAVEKLSKRMKLWTIAAERAYNETWGDWDVEGKTFEELEFKYTHSKNVAIKKFTELLAEGGYDPKYFDHELTYKLEQYLIDVRKEWEDSNPGVELPTQEQNEIPETAPGEELFLETPEPSQIILPEIEKELSNPSMSSSEPGPKHELETPPKSPLIGKAPSNLVESGEPAKSVPNHGSHLDRIHVGLMLCQSRLEVATFNPTTQSPNIHFSDEPNMTVNPSKGKNRRLSSDFAGRLEQNDSRSVTDDYQIPIGGPLQSSSSSDTSEHRLNIYNLLQRTCPFPALPIGTVSKVEDIVVVFLKYVKSIIRIKVGQAPLGNLVISTESALCSRAKKWLKDAGMAVGFINVRVFSSVFTAGIAYLTDNRHCISQNATQLFFIQYFKTSFSMAVLKGISGSVVSEVASGSEDTGECDQTFKNLQDQLWTGQKLDHSKSTYVQKAYKVALGKVQKSIHPKILNHAICISESKNEIYFLIRELVTLDRLALENPSLRGSCIVASSADGTVSNFPSTMTIRDSRRAHLLFWVDGKEHLFRSMNSTLEPGTVFSCLVSLPLGRTVRIKLLEWYHSSLPKKEICRHRVRVESEVSNIAWIEYWASCTMAEDGVYSLHFRPINELNRVSFTQVEEAVRAEVNTLYI